MPYEVFLNTSSTSCKGFPIPNEIPKFYQHVLIANNSQKTCSINIILLKLLKCFQGMVSFKYTLKKSKCLQLLSFPSWSRCGNNHTNDFTW